MAGVFAAATACNGAETASPTEPAVATTITVAPTPVSLTSLGDTHQLVATVRDQRSAEMSGAGVTWSSSRTDIAEVSQAGLVTAMGVGSASITATSGAASAAVAASVSQVAAEIELVPESLSLAGPGDTATVSAAVTDAGGSEIPNAPLEWSSDDESVAAVDASGKVTAVSGGLALITAEATGVEQAISQTLTAEVDEGTLVGPSGGEVSLAEGIVHLEIPEDALSTFSYVTAEPANSLPPGHTAILGTAFDFGPDGLVFDQPVTLTIAYQPGSVPQSVPEQELRLHKLEGGYFAPVPGSTVDVVGHTVSGEINGFSVYAILPRLLVTTTTLPDAIVNEGYGGHALSVTGGNGSYLWTVASGALPAGLELATNGVIDGTPTATAAAEFTVSVESGPQTAERALSIVVAGALRITTESLPAGVVGTAYSQLLTTEGAPAPYSWSVATGSLPPGLELDASTGEVAGAPTQPGTSGFTAEVTNGSQTAQQALSVTVYPVLQVTTTSLPNGAPGSPYSATLAASGGDGDYSWSVVEGSLPDVLTLDSSTGLISGTPTGAASTFTVEVASGEGQAATRELTIDVSADLTVFTTTLPNGIVGVAYSETLAATGGDGSYSWSLATGSGPLPAGLGLAGGGQITGTPAVGGASNFTVEVASDGQIAQQL